MQIVNCTDSLAELAGFETGAELAGGYIIDLLSPVSLEVFETYLRSGDFRTPVMCRLASGRHQTSGALVSVAYTGNASEGDLMTLLCMPTVDYKSVISQLEQERDGLEKQNQWLTVLSNLLAHDLRGSLHAILGSLDLIRHQGAAGLDAATQTQMERMQAAAGAMTRVLGNVTQLLRARDGSYPVDLIDMNALVDGLIRDVRTQYGEHLQIERVSELPSLMGRASLLTQLIRNLLENSVKYGGENPLVVRVGYLPGDVNSFYVEDNGVGVHEKDLERVLLPLTRADHDGLYAQGTGMGLALVAAITERHGGTVCLESERGKGTTVFFRLNMFGSEEQPQLA